MTTFLTLGILFLTTVETNASLVTGLTAYWQFEGDGQDSSPNGKDLTLVGSPAFSGSGLFGQALSLTGNSSQFAQRADSSFDLVSSEFTIQLWVNFNSVSSAEQTLIEKFTGGAGPGYTVTMNSNSAANRIQVYAPGAGVNFISSASVSTAGNWNHLLLRRTGNVFDLFLNGIATSQTGSGAISTSTQPLLIGERDGTQNFPVDGLLDEIAFWNRSLDNTEVSSLYNGGSGLSLSEFSAVPEPSAFLLIIGCTACFSFTASRRRRRFEQTA